MTDTKHEGLPVAGYKPQSAANVALVNEFKADEERLLRKLDALGSTWKSGDGVVVTDVITASLTMKIGGPAYDQRWIAVARTHFQEGFMALNRAVFQPGRVKLPEDE